MKWLVRRGDPHVTGRVFEKQNTSAVEFVELTGLLLKVAVKTLCAKLDPGNQTSSALDFHHALWKDSEAVADYI